MMVGSCGLSSTRRLLGTRRNQLHEIIDDIPALQELKARLGDIQFGLVIEARPIRPSNPRLPNPRHDPPEGPMRTHILQEPNKPTRFDHATKFPKGGHLKLMRQHTE